MSKFLFGSLAILLIGAIVLGIVLLGNADRKTGQPFSNTNTERGQLEEKDFTGAVFPKPLPVKDFSLRDHRGDTFRLVNARGKVVVLTFLYTSCGDVCPFTAFKLRLAMEMLTDEERKEVELVAISTDPERDTRQRAAEYSAQVGLDIYPNWHFLIGTNDEVRSILNDMRIGESEFGKEEKTIPSLEELREELPGLFGGMSEADLEELERVRQEFGGGYDVFHAVPVLLIDRDGQMRVMFGFDMTPGGLAGDIRRLIHNQLLR